MHQSAVLQNIVPAFHLQNPEVLRNPDIPENGVPWFHTVHLHFPLLPAQTAAHTVSQFHPGTMVVRYSKSVLPTHSVLPLPDALILTPTLSACVRLLLSMHIPMKTSLLAAPVPFLIRSATLPEVSDVPMLYPVIFAVLPAASAPHPRSRNGNPDSPYQAPVLPNPSNFSHHSGWKTVLFPLWKNRCIALLPAACRFLPESVFPLLWSVPHITHAAPLPDFPFLLP